jgi:hypothetical protein
MATTDASYSHSVLAVVPLSSTKDGDDISTTAGDSSQVAQTVDDDSFTHRLQLETYSVPSAGGGLAHQSASGFGDVSMSHSYSYNESPDTSVGAPAVSAPSTAVQRSLSERIGDFRANPQNWQRVSASAEQARAKAARGGVSIESVYRNPSTGEVLHVHDVFKPSGGQIPKHPPFRDFGKGE